ncbi:MAG: PIN domain-containing protein [Patescibacteria group bacterium]
MKIVVDTSVLIDFSRAHTGLFKELIVQSQKGADLYTPTVVMTEFWAGDDMKNESNVKSAERIFSRLIKMPLSEEIAKKAGELIRKKDAFGFDAIVAASALKIDAQVATSNTKHFSKIKNLKLWKNMK